jgi:hypothetical protein
MDGIYCALVTLIPKYSFAATIRSDFAISKWCAYVGLAYRLGFLVSILYVQGPLRVIQRGNLSFFIWGRG